MSIPWIERIDRGIVVRIQAQPRASKTEIVGLHGDPPRLKIRLAAPPVDGEANEELLRFLKKRLEVAYSQLELLRGDASKSKDILCVGLDILTIRERLGQTGT